MKFILPIAILGCSAVVAVLLGYYYYDVAATMAAAYLQSRGVAANKLQNQLYSASASHNRSKELLISVEKEIVTEIEINAPPSQVWEILTDFEKYPAWNPFIKKISGEAARNEKLEVHMPNPRGGTMIVTPTVLMAEKDRELRWLGRSEGDVFNGEHRFLIEPIENNKMRFIQSEKFTGSMVESLGEWLDTAVKQNFEDMNIALKQRAEKQ